MSYYDILYNIPQSLTFNTVVYTDNNIEHVQRVTYNYTDITSGEHISNVYMVDVSRMSTHDETFLHQGVESVLPFEFNCLFDALKFIHDKKQIALEFATAEFQRSYMLPTSTRISKLAPTYIDYIANPSVLITANSKLALKKLKPNMKQIKKAITDLNVLGLLTKCINDPNCTSYALNDIGLNRVMNNESFEVNYLNNRASIRMYKIAMLAIVVSLVAAFKDEIITLLKLIF